MISDEFHCMESMAVLLSMNRMAIERVITHLLVIYFIHSELLEIEKNNSTSNVVLVQYKQNQSTVLCPLSLQFIIIATPTNDMFSIIDSNFSYVIERKQLVE